MSKINRWIAVFGYAGVPILMAVTFYHADPSVWNFTALINSPLHRSRALICGLPVFCYLFYAITAAGLHTYPTRFWLPRCGLLLALVLLAVLIPYRDSGMPIRSSLHILFTFLGLVYLNVLLFHLAWQIVWMRNLYFAGFTASWFVSLTHDSINGTSEIIYTCMICILLARLLQRTDGSR